MSGYAELQVTTNFSFLEGASHAKELVEQAAALGIRAMAITDRNSLAGVVRAHVAARDYNRNHPGDFFQIIIGARLDFRDGPSLLCLPQDRAAYGRLSSFISKGRRAAPKGQCWLDWVDFFPYAEGQQVILLPPEMPDQAFREHLQELKAACGDRLSLGISRLHGSDDMHRLKLLAELAHETGAPLLATNDVLYHHPERLMLQDILTCIRHGCTIDTAGYLLQANAERHLKPPEQMLELFEAYPEAIARGLEVASRCTFNLDELRYEYPEETKGKSATPQEELVRLAWEGAALRYPEGIPEKVRGMLEHELALIGRLDYAPYFLTVYDIVRFATEKDILCQGRGSAANSAVCYCLKITAVNPNEVELLFERFLSEERKEPPDIDVDFEHERREEVIQYIYEKYGRGRAGLTATVIQYQPKSAIREVGKALGLSADTVERMRRSIWGWGRSSMDAKYLIEAGLDPDDPRTGLTLSLARDLIGFPRHLSQHVGGFVISRGPLAELVPIENAAMGGRTVIEWDKDDIDALGIMKVDVLALGMLTAIRKAFAMLEQQYGKTYTLASVPQNDPKVYDMLCKADSIGVFQVESRAQMTMLPRLKPRNYYDLVVEVAIVRPGPIQGDMVHPYLNNRKRVKEAGDDESVITYPSEKLRGVLKRTYGVPLFQEQAMQIAMKGAGFTASEADQLRRAMAAFRRTGNVGKFRDKFIEGMIGNHYEREFAEACFRQIEGFGEYGFPESHAASFAHLVYVSAWIKCHYPAAFAAALLNSQPMGFYAPAQLVRDARDHGVEVRQSDVNYSDWDNTLEAMPRAGTALRLGLRQVKSCNETDAKRLIAARGEGYDTIRELWRRASLPIAALEVLARADCFGSLGLDRRAALWAIKALGEKPLPLFEFSEAEARARPGDNQPPADAAHEPEVRLPALTTGEQVIQDYREIRLTLRPHPLALLRPQLQLRGMIQAKALATYPEKHKLSMAGLVLVRQRPGTASGVIFATIEDETGVGNLVIWPKVFERYRRILLGSRLLGVEGRLQREGLVVHVVAEKLIDHTAMLGGLSHLTTDDVFAEVVARADEVARPVREVAAALPGSRDFK